MRTRLNSTYRLIAAVAVIALGLLIWPRLNLAAGGAIARPAFAAGPIADAAAPPPVAALPLARSTVGGRKEYGRYGLYIPVSGGSGPYGYDPQWELKGGWKGWADRTCETIRANAVDRVLIWGPDGNTDPQGWRVRDTPIVDPVTQGVEIFDKSRAQRGDNLVFDAALYRNPASLDSFERSVADEQAKIAALRRVKAELDASARTLAGDKAAQGVMVIYLGNVFDVGIGGARSLQEWPLGRAMQRVDRVVAPYKAAGASVLAVDATSGDRPTGISKLICDRILATSSMGFGVEVLAESPHWATSPRIWSFANAEYFYRARDEDGPYVPIAKFPGRIGLMHTGRPNPAKWVRGDTVFGADKREALAFIRLAQSYGFDVYSDVPIPPQERKAAGLR